MYGENIMPRATPASILDSVKQQFKDKMTLAAMATALLAAICGGIAKGWSATVEGFGLLIFLIVVNLIITSFDFMKDSRFLRLQEFLKKEKISVIRGKAFQTRSISVWKLVVGDVIMIERGSRVPADCIIIESSNLKVQSDIPEDEKRDKNDNPFLTAGSIIVNGNAKVLVAAVGSSSTRPIQDEKINLNEDSPLK